MYDLLKWLKVKLILQISLKKKKKKSQSISPSLKMWNAKVTRHLAGDCILEIQIYIMIKQICYLTTKTDIWHGEMLYN